MIKFKVSGSFKNMEAFGERMKRREQYRALVKYGPIGVTALSNATPVESAETARSWTYDIVSKPGYFAIHWSNMHVQDGVPIAVLLQYGHGTRNGGYVRGRDYINPALRPIFDQIANDMWKVVTK